MTTNPVMTITDEVLVELEAAADAATEGPWQWNHGRLLHNVPGSHSDTILDIEDRVWRPNSRDESHIALNNPSTTKALLRHIAELKDRCAAAENDAERYAWIRDQHNDGMGSTWVAVYQPGNGWVSLDTFVSGVKAEVLNLDDAVDAAIQSEGETN